ncbi:MAG: ABC transporter permease [Myxococcota bacterium]
MTPRWKKVASDLFQQRSRSVLVVLSIATGVFAVGAVAGTYDSLKEGLTSVYAKGVPAHARIFFLEPFPLDLHETVRRFPGIADAEARRSVDVRMVGDEETSKGLQLTAILDFKDIRIDRVRPVSGEWPPKQDEVLLERSSLESSGLKIGDTITVETPLRRKRTLRIAGTVHDPGVPPSFFTGRLHGTVSMDTIEALGEPPLPDQLLLRVKMPNPTRKDVEKVVKAVRARLEDSGLTVVWNWIPPPGQHPAKEPITSLLFILTVLGVVVLLLSGFLLFNTITAILTQQTRQIGIMKSIGATTAQIAELYVVLVLAYCTLAVLVAVPTGFVTARFAAESTAGMLNLDLPEFGVPPWILGSQVALGFLVPLLAALPPIIRASRITVREALAFYGLPSAASSPRFIDVLARKVRIITRPALLSLRNAFRRRLRLGLTLATLTTGGAIFMAVLSTRASMTATLEQALSYWAYDVEVQFIRPYRADRVKEEILRVPGVAAVETWGFSAAQLMKDWQGTEESRVFMLAPPAETQMLRPTLVEGRWLRKDDEASVVINTEVLRNNPDVKVGDHVLLRVGGHRTTWRVVGMVRGVLSGPWVYVNRPYHALVAREGGRAASVQIVTTEKSPEFLAALSQRLEDHLRAEGYQVSSVENATQWRSRVEGQFNVITSFLIAMALLMALVGALALAGTMGINVLERVKEIGVIRAVGASTPTVMGIFVLEGMTVGLLSYLIAMVLSLPLAYLMSYQVGVTFTRAPFDFTWSAQGAGGWLVLVMILSVLASLWPAWNAARISVREVLAME